jgi:hypothetical protein
MYRRFILPLGMFLVSHLQMAGQTPVPRTILVPEHAAQIMTIQRTVSTLAPSLLLSQDPGKSPAHFSRLVVVAYGGDHSLDYLSPMDEVKTMTLTQSSLPLGQLWGGRIQLDAFQSTLHTQNVQLGPAGYDGMEGFAPTRQGYPGAPLSIHFSGLSLSFHFGRESRTRHATQGSRHITQFVGTVLN